MIMETQFRATAVPRPPRPIILSVDSFSKGPEATAGYCYCSSSIGSTYTSLASIKSPSRWKLRRRTPQAAGILGSTSRKMMHTHCGWLLKRCTYTPLSFQDKGTRNQVGSLPMSHYPFRSSACREQYHARYAQRARAWPVPCETRLIETRAGWTHVRLTGSREAPLLVLLHGARGNSLMWVPNIAALSAGFYTCAIDTIGETGLSVSRGRLSRTEQLLAWLDEVIGVLAPGQPVSLAGLSYGGYLASQYALRFPGRVRRLVLLSPAATVLPVSAAMLSRAMLTVLPHVAFRRGFYQWLLADSVRSGPDGRTWVDQAVDDWALAERCFAYLHLVGAAVLDDDTLR
jgi:hypothetical protein